MNATEAPLDGMSLVPLRFEMKRNVSNAKASWSVREGILVRVSSSGISGIGEASPLPAFSPETLDDVRADLDRARAALASSSISLDGDALDAVAGALVCEPCAFIEKT